MAYLPIPSPTFVNNKYKFIVPGNEFGTVFIRLKATQNIPVGLATRVVVLPEVLAGSILYPFVNQSLVSITHGFGLFPVVNVYLSTGEEIVGDVVHANNIVTISFSQPLTGTIVLS